MTTIQTDGAPFDCVDGIPTKLATSKLDKETQSLVKLIFDNDMFSNAMKSMDIGERNQSIFVPTLTLVQ